MTMTGNKNFGAIGILIKNIKKYEVFALSIRKGRTCDN